MSPRNHPMHLKNMDPMQNNIVVLQKNTNLFVDRHTIGSEFFMHISKYIIYSLHFVLK